MLVKILCFIAGEGQGEGKLEIIDVPRLDRELQVLAMKTYPRKRFGQHFLHDENVVAKIVTAIHPKPTDFIVEIGPGLGALTQKILAKTGKLTAIEIDRDIIPELKKNCQSLGELTVHEADVLNFDLSTLSKIPATQRIIGNLPYNISTPLLFHLLDYASLILDMHFMLQKEVAERITAEPNTNAYGRLSIMTQYFCQADLLFLVSPNSFFPPPKVDSAVIRLIPHKTLPHQARDFALFAEVVKTAFQYRRKTLQNCLKSFVSKEQLLNLGIDPMIRPECLTIAQFVAIANAL